MSPAVSQTLGEFRRGLETIYGPRLERLVLFGSQARGDAQPDSDIDVLVVLRGAVRPLEEGRRISSFLGDLCLRRDAVINCVYVSSERAASADTALLRNIRAEGVAV
jgi:predicted nucleotidyltransferase